jgi:uncharacterized membrane protein (UPF0127 family)
MRPALPLALLACILVAATARAQEAGPTEPVVVVTKAGPLSLALEVADDNDERQTGLMFRQSLADRSGMLFDFGVTRPVFMWMKNTFIPLDMLFVAEDGRIVRIADHTTPESTDTIASGQPVRGVVELAGGAAASLGIAEGDLVLRPLFPQ